LWRVRAPVDGGFVAGLVSALPLRQDAACPS
jgi:hypothetical protein